MTQEIIDQLAAAIEQQGLSYLGSVVPNLSQDHSYYVDWLTQGKHGSMKYLELHAEVRAELSAILPSAQTVLVFGLNYNLGDKIEFSPTKPRIAQYARLKDYHKLMRRQAEAAVASVRTASNFNFRICIDTVPLFERSIAAQTESGFIGKNTCFIHPKLGSLFLLGEIVTDLPGSHFKADVHHAKQRSSTGGCGSCKRCQVHCPTGALAKDYSIDATKCLSYWTIEHRGLIPQQYWQAIRSYWYGCDICQLVCPYNRNTERAKLPETWKTMVEQLDLAEVALMNELQYQIWFGGTPMTRAKRQGLRRNALIALIMHEDERSADILTICLQDSDPVVRETASALMQWSLDGR